MLIEFKAETVALTQQVFDQAAIYNRQLKVPYLLVSNGIQTIVAEVKKAAYYFLDNIPVYTKLNNINK